ncbi:MAG: hypothetical protein IT477_05670 [Rhodanobacteraceae bacterium]|nr:hypothetical protein [Rhodanobacteraceae bacterium]
MTFALAFLDAGHMSVARRMSSHLAEWIPNDRVGAIGASLVLLAMVYFAVRIIHGLLRAPGAESTAHAAG